jgi:hypothetical protein
VQAPKDTDDERRGEAAVSLANNADAAMGICLSSSRIFFTDGATNIFSMPIGGGDVIQVSGALQSAQGCVYDGDGTVFIADEADGRVYGFSGKAVDLKSRPLSLAFDAPGAVGLAVFAGGAWQVHMHHLAVVLAIVAAMVGGSRA